jgi:MFS family permease
MADLKSNRCNDHHVFIICSLASIAGLMYGYDFGIFSGAIPFIANQFSLNGILLGWVVAIYLLGGAIGCLLASYLIDKFGRKKLLIFNSFLLIVTVLGVTFLSTVETLCIWRFIRGINVGVALVISAIYIKEISPEYLRDRMLSLMFFMLVLGFSLALVIIYLFVDTDNLESWRWMLGSAVVPAFVFYMGSLFIPETPFWLIKEDRVVEARRVLTKLYPNENIEEDIVAIKVRMNNMKARPLKCQHENFLSPMVDRNTILVLLLCVCSNVILYMQMIFEDVHISFNNGLFIGMLIGIASFLCLIIGVFLRNKIRQKVFVNILSGFMTVLLFILAWLFQSNSVNVELVLVLFIIYICTFTFNLGSAAWEDIFKSFLNPNNKSVSISSLFFWIASFLLILVTPYLIKVQLVNYFLLFCFLNIANLTYAFVSMFESSIVHAQGIISYLENEKSVSN